MRTCARVWRPTPRSHGLHGWACFAPCSTCSISFDRVSSCSIYWFAKSQTWTGTHARSRHPILLHASACTHRERNTPIGETSAWVGERCIRPGGGQRQTRTLQKQALPLLHFLPIESCLHRRLEHGTHLDLGGVPVQVGQHGTDRVRAARVRL